MDDVASASLGTLPTQHAPAAQGVANHAKGVNVDPLVKYRIIVVILIGHEPRVRAPPPQQSPPPCQRVERDSMNSVVSRCPVEAETCVWRHPAFARPARS